MAHPGHRKTKPSGRRVSKANVMADLKAGVAKAGRAGEKFSSIVESVVSPLPGKGVRGRAVKWAAGKTGVTALIKRNIPDINLIRTVKNWPSATGIPFTTPAREAFRSAGLTGGPAKYPKPQWGNQKPGAIRVMRGINPQDLIAPAIKKMKGPSWTGAAKTQEGRYISWRTQQANELIKESLRLKPHSSGRWSPPNMPVGPPTVAKLKYPGGRKLDPLKKRPRR